MSGSHSPGYAAKVMFSNVTVKGAELVTDDLGFLDYLRRNGNCYVCFVTPVPDDSGSENESEPQSGG